MVVLTWLVAACANSPSDELAKAQTSLIRLEKQGAGAYLPEQILRVRESIQLAREYIQRNRFEEAGKTLRSTLTALDSCAAALDELRARAKSTSEAQYFQLRSGVDSLALLLQKMPRQSYLDQNRYDLCSLKLISMRQQVEAIREDIEQKDYPLALQKGQALQRHLRKSLAIIMESSPLPVVAVSSSEINTR
jgi:hypothetical protein